jgi:hypothetical protein
MNRAACIHRGRGIVWPRGARFVLIVCYLTLTCGLLSCDRDLRESFYSSLGGPVGAGAISRLSRLW